MKKLLISAAALLMSVAAFAQKAEIVFVDAAEFPLYGKAVENTSGRYERLPAELNGVIRKGVWDLGLNSAGMFIRFRSDSPSIHAKWISTENSHMPHMTDVGDNGLDLYTLIDDEWRFVGSAFGWTRNASKQRKIVGTMDPVMREYMLYLSLYDRVDSLYIGIEDGYRIEAPQVVRPANKKPIVMYGTSILQGGCASRPGMAHTNIIARRLDREVINLGFSGNARLDYEIADLIAKVKDPALIVMDNVPNSIADTIMKKTEKFYHIIRKAHPDVPVIFVEDPHFPHMLVDNSAKLDVESRNIALKEIYGRLKKAGEKNIYYVEADGMLGDDSEATVDGTHLTDLGMTRYVDHIMPTIKKALRKSK